MRFFISHSAQTEHAQAVLSRLCARLRDAGHDVFVDADLIQGEQWRSVLYHEIARCHVAVVLLEGTMVSADEHSLTKRWVQREVDLLLWRRALNRTVVIVPVMLDATKPAAVRRAGFAEFTEHQFLLAEGLSSDEVAAKVVESFAPCPRDADSRMERWFDKIEAVLDRIGHREALRKAALALGVSAEDADQVLLENGTRFFAHQFLGRSADTATVEAVERILFYSDAGTLHQLVGLIAPTWVDHCASLPLVLGEPTEGSVAVLNATDPRTAIHYVRRATCMDLTVPTEQVDAVTGEDGYGELLDKCESAVLRLLGGDPEMQTLLDMPPDEVLDGPPKPGYLIIRTGPSPSTTVGDVVEHLRRVYRWLAMILIVGTDPPSLDVIARWHLGDARILKPALEPHEEFRAHRTIRQLLTMIDEGSGGKRR